MRVFTLLDLSPQWTAAILIAAPMLVAGIILALIVTRVSAWYARRWQVTDEEESLAETFLTDRLFPKTHYGILAARDKSESVMNGEGGRTDDRSET